MHLHAGERLLRLSRTPPGRCSLRVAQDDPKKIEPNTVTVMLVEEIAQKTVGLYLLDANSGAELKSLEKIEVAISM